MSNIEEEMPVIKISIVTKMVLHVVVLIFIAITIITYIEVKNESQVLTDSLIQRIKMQTRQIASGTKSAFWSLNWIFVENLLRETREQSTGEVIFAKVVKPNGEVYMADDRAFYGETIDASLLFEKETLIDNYFFKINQEEGMLLVRPVKIGEETWFVFVGVSIKSVNGTIRAQLIKNIIWGGIVILVAAILSYLLSRSISAPLISLAQSAMLISKENLQQPVLIHSKDEVGLLSHAFNRMLKDLKITLSELKISEYRNRVLIETASKAKVGIALLQNVSEKKGVFKYVNQYLSDLSGFSQDKLLEMTLNDMIPPESSDNIWQLYNLNSDQKKLKDAYQLNVVKKNGKQIPIEISTGTTSFDGRNALVCYVRDITEKLLTEEKLKRYSENLENTVARRTEELQQVIVNLKNTQSQLIQSEKLASIGQLAAGIAHEINTPIQYVGDNTRFLQDAFNDMNLLINNHGDLLKSLKDTLSVEDLIKDAENSFEDADIEYLQEEIPRAIEQTLEGLEHVSKIVHSMKEFSHPGVKEKTPVDINRAIENTIAVSRNEWKYVAEIKTDLDTSLQLVYCLPGELNQVFLNMIINAAHAIADTADDNGTSKGMIRISTRRDGDDVEIRISDTGPGIPEEIQSKIFDPFFTTKDVGKGTGQGLAISRSVIVEKHNGTINMETGPEKGTTFVIHIPISQEHHENTETIDE